MSSVSLGPKDEHIFSAFDLLRNKRNKFIYEPDLPCSHTEAKEALEIAGQFVEVLAEVLDSKNGQGRLGFNEKKNYPEERKGRISIKAKLSTFDATMIVVSLIIGIGIFRTPAMVAAAARTPALFYAAWALGVSFIYVFYATAATRTRSTSGSTSATPGATSSGPSASASSSSWPVMTSKRSRAVSVPLRFPLPPLSVNSS